MFLVISEGNRGILTSARANFVAYRLIPRYYNIQILNSVLLQIVTEEAKCFLSDTGKGRFTLITNIDFLFCKITNKSTITINL